MPNYLVTGSSGFIGNHVSNFLESRGHSVLRTDIRGEADIVSDLREIDWKDFDLSRFDGVIHLGAKISVPESFQKPDLYREVNVDSTRRLFHSCVEAGVPRIVFASSAAVYGEVEGGIMKIGNEGTPQSPYADSKKEGELIASEIASINTRIICLRFFNVYGPGQSHDGQYASVIPLFINKMLKGENITIFGDGEQTRDFIHVSDLSRIISSSFLVDIPPFSIYNLGSGSSVSINYLHSTMREIFSDFGLVVKDAKYEKTRAGDIDHSIAEISETNAKFPNIELTTLRQGISDLISRTLDVSDA